MKDVVFGPATLLELSSFLIKICIYYFAREEVGERRREVAETRVDTSACCVSMGTDVPQNEKRG